MADQQPFEARLRSNVQGEPVETGCNLLDCWFCHARHLHCSRILAFADDVLFSRLGEHPSLWICSGHELCWPQALYLQDQPLLGIDFPPIRPAPRLQRPSRWTVRSDGCGLLEPDSSCCERLDVVRRHSFYVFHNEVVGYGRCSCVLMRERSPHETKPRRRTPFQVCAGRPRDSLVKYFAYQIWKLVVQHGFDDRRSERSAQEL